jgi:hypothetical protein
MSTIITPDGKILMLNALAGSKRLGIVNTIGGVTDLKSVTLSVETNEALPDYAKLTFYVSTVFDVVVPSGQTRIVQYVRIIHPTISANYVDVPLSDTVENRTFENTGTYTLTSLVVSLGGN